MFEQDGQVHRAQIEVELTLTDGTRMIGYLYAAAGQRLVDLLNDHRSFVPFTDEAGDIVILNKGSIARLSPVDKSIGAPKKATPRWMGN
jgi:hypothetical protein